MWLYVVTSGGYSEVNQSEKCYTKMVVILNSYRTMGRERQDDWNMTSMSTVTINNT
jgi:hypothetical protein